ncbi:Trehalose-phosphatase/synthase 7 isoform 1 [Hibiscus syriacus]|uniref:Trehalose-phosphatase/synthase 7 isoform 1 n=1 Tax=Hibiscus syriacus TaxID=106335 RepID=A0A6A3D728_HIBSY|nr:Trehalose-phosphatase/synthase 7 isoform 1 [Hibiscus syriacus]
MDSGLSWADQWDPNPDSGTEASDYKKKKKEGSGKGKFSKSFLSFKWIKELKKKDSCPYTDLCIMVFYVYPFDSKMKFMLTVVGIPLTGAALEALVAIVFASVISIKSAYAKLQMAQNPYNNDAIQAADQAVVKQLKVLSELKHKFLKHELDVSPQASLILAEIQEQQSLMRTGEINIKKLEYDIERKVADIALHHKQSKIAPFKQVHGEETKRNFVRLMMKIAKWDVDVAAKSIEPGTILAKQSHRCFVFESFVCKTMLEGFVYHDFGVTKEEYFNEFKSLKTAQPKSFLVQNPDSSFAKFAMPSTSSLFILEWNAHLLGT